MPVLPTAPTLADLQAYVRALEHERGFEHQDVRDKCLLLGEEVGELFKAVRHATRMMVDERAAASPTSAVGDELADVLIFLCSIANRMGVDLERAFRRKEQVNAARRWTSAAPASDEAAAE